MKAVIAWGLRALGLASAVAVATPIAPAGAALPAPVPLAQGWQVSEAGGPLRTVEVPHVLGRGKPDEARFFGTTAVYRLRFTGPATPAGVRWALRFEAVRRTMQATLNGVPIGSHADPYVPFELQVPPGVLRPGQPNELVVRVDSRKGKEPREGWWNWGGITRPVQLVAHGPLDLEESALLSDVACPDGGPTAERPCRTVAKLDALVHNRSDRTVRAPRVEVRIAGAGLPGGAVTAGRTTRSLAPGETTRVRFDVPLPNARLWSPEDPYRYQATVGLLTGGVSSDRDVQRLGLRQVAVRDGMLTLNGRDLQLRGASLQEDLPGRGPALRPQDAQAMVDGLRALGANVTRAHYLLSEDLLDRLDAAGILVWSQAPIYHRDRLLETPAQRDEALETLRRTIVAARRHPSVIAHSVANELSAVPDEVPGTKAFLDRSRAVVADADPTVPAAVDLLSYPGYPPQATYGRFPLLGVNSYFGWYPGKKRHSTARLADLGPFLDATRRAYPGAAIVLTEFGAEATFHGPEGEKETYAFQSRYVREVLDVIASRPWVGGAIYWTLREFAVKPDWDGGAKRDVPRDGIHNKGLVTYDGRAKPAYEVAREDFAATALYREVSAAEAAGLPEGRDAGRPWALVLALVAIVAVLAVDVWALRGILRRGRPRRPASPEPERAPA